MTTSILTASIGGIDEIKGIPRQSIPVDYHAYFDNNLPYPMPNLNNRLKSKYVKIQSHRFLNSDYFIWIDGRVEVLADTFAEEMITALGDNDVALFGHPERKTIFEELTFIQDQIDEGNQYLVSRYANQRIGEEFEFLYDQRVLPLYACTIFIRRNTPELNEAFNEWWRRCIEFSYFDQCMFSYACRDLKVKTLNREDFKNQFVINQHVR